MGRILLHLCGPIAIYSYGLCIAIAASLFVYGLSRDPRFKTLHLEPVFSSIFMIGALSILLGGRILHLLAVQEEQVHLVDFISFWEPGFSVLGSVIALLFCVPLYVRHCGVPALPFIDLVATYAGILQGVSRLGCFFAGCCFGCSTSGWWAITYIDPDSAAPLHMLMHPVQLYSATLLLLIFCGMYTVGRRTLTITGQQTAVYLMLSSCERFITDFWRGDRDFFTWLSLPLSIHQIIALGLFVAGGILFVLVTFLRHRHQYEHIRSC
jgi:phosphatidylglycerol---prolipoprotein diacylglyceryl transferase